MREKHQKTFEKGLQFKSRCATLIIAFVGVKALTG